MIVYTVRGGVSAVIWTDVVQMFVYLAGALLVFAALLHADPGRMGEVVRAGAAAGKFQVLICRSIRRAVYTLWAGLIGGVALTLATHGTDQFLVQRLLVGALGARGARAAWCSAAFIVLAQFVLFLLIGVMLFAYYQHVPLPRRSPAPTRSCRCSSSPRSRTAPPDSSSRRSSRRRCRRRSTRWRPRPSTIST